MHNKNICQFSSLVFRHFSKFRITILFHPYLLYMQTLLQVYQFCDATIYTVFSIARCTGVKLILHMRGAIWRMLFANLKWKGKGFKIKTRGTNLFEYTWLNNLRSAEDVVLVAKNGAELESMAEDLARASAEVGLTINKSKTNILSNIKILR